MLAVIFITLLGVALLLTNTHSMRFSSFAEKSRTAGLTADIGRKLWKRCESAIVLVNSNLFSRRVDSRSWSSTDVKWKFTVGIAVQPNLNSWRGVKILSSYGRCKLALAASRLTVPPTQSHGPLPYDVTRKCHSDGIPKSYSWQHKFAKFFLFFYCDIVSHFHINPVLLSSVYGSRPVA